MPARQLMRNELDSSARIGLCSRPVFFVHGTRDPFGTVEELQRAIKMIPAKTKLLEIEGAGHDLGFKGKAKGTELLGMVLAEFTAYLARVKE